MKYPQDVKKIHEEIQKKIFLMLPEKWEKLCLYASIIEGPNHLQKGEMFFYYYPRGILKKNPVNVYEVPRKFGIDESQYFRFADDLYDSIKKLKKMCIESGEKPWSNITIIIENLKYKEIYGYEDLYAGEFGSKEMRIIWTYKYMKEPYESFNKSEREIIDRYEPTEKNPQVLFELPIYLKGTNKKLDEIRNIQKKLEFVREETIEEMEFVSTHIPKSQILNSVKIKV